MNKPKKIKTVADFAEAAEQENAEASFFDMMAEYEFKGETPTGAFRILVETQIALIDGGKQPTNPWLKPLGNGFLLKLGKLKKRYHVHKMEQVKHILTQVLVALDKKDERLIAEVEEAYMTATRRKAMGEENSK